ncbi:hypothetical protein [Galactobacter valiniphilus]|uniref:hypothetical protein n=1 Tax=Galactobacter valiniphilus TaxID=2676122 RepID=UPI003735539F
MTSSPILVSARVQATNRSTFVWVPLLVLGGATVLTLAIWWVVKAAGAEAQLFSGSVQAPFWYLLVVGAQTVALTFPFTQALSLSRRDFWLGAMLNFSVFSILFGTLLWLLGVVERATGGWWMNGRMFAFPLKLEGGVNIPEAGSPWYLLLYALMAMMALSVGFAFGTIYKRFGPAGLTLAITGTVAALIALLYLSIQGDWWPTLQAWFPMDRFPGNVAIITALIAALGFLVSWALIRKVPA